MPDDDQLALPPEARAALAAARGRTGQAFRQIKKAAKSLAQADEGFYTAGHVSVRGPADIEAVSERIALELAEHGEVDVVVLIPAHPSERKDTAPFGAQTTDHQEDPS